MFLAWGEVGISYPKHKSLTLLAGLTLISVAVSYIWGKWNQARNAVIWNEQAGNGSSS